MGDAVELHEHDAGTSVTLACLARLRASSDARWSVHASSSSASTDEIAVVTMTRPITIAQRRPEAVDLDAGEQLEDPSDEDRVEHDRAEAERHDRERHDEERQRRPDDGVGDADHESGEQRIPAGVDREARQHGGEQPERERGEHGDDDRAPQHLVPGRTLAGGTDHAGLVSRGDTREVSHERRVISTSDVDGADRISTLGR